MANSYDHGHVHPQHVQYSLSAHQYAPEADFHPGYDDDDMARPAGLGRLLSLLGAAGSLALVVGVGVWGYKLVMRDVSGVPVVRALEGPMRVQPDNPGGERADHQGLAVNTVAAKGTAAPPPDRLKLAPQPVSLIEEDAPMGEMAADAAEPAVHTAQASAADETADDAVQDGSVDALVQELARQARPLPENAVQTGDIPTAQPAAAIVQPEPLPAIDPADLMAAAPDPALLEAPGVKQSPRPQPRPARTVRAAPEPDADLAEAINAAVESAAALDVDPEAIPDGTRMAQLGAFDSPEVARAEWERLTGQFGDYLDGKQRVVQKATSGGRTFYRLRAMGFDDLSDARRFCSALNAEDADCIPAIAR
ncbi:Sporulation related domain-containing protein [Cribrihabitans marinus]|uniref:Sporulation related domain-containing protein n=1 Tax=Cribrihabitans marinus TaxID=1227549 RepID=A0A1H6QSM4_9RHOB|nr:SPOR domain-containing protein [Cribrihabitans marinus]GGH19757.1 sporulation protein [Cribrihabitans marinus]SEI46609.1 Sporulation related domain-containing protein [Cribrihabitans marinus]